jgi:hypothetical protein
MRAALVLGLAVVIAACTGTSSDARKHKKRPPATTGWYFSYGDPNPTTQADGVSSIWTASPRVEPHYWLKNWTTPFKPEQTISITYKIDAMSGAPVVKSTECATWQDKSALAALMIRKSTNNSDYFNRAWYTVRGPMTVGTHTISAPFGDGTDWTFVSAGAAGNPAKWADILARPIDVALTFNGCSSMGHGAYVEGGSIKITIVSVTVQ